MASENGVRQLVGRLRAAGLDYGPRGEASEVVSAWVDILDHPDITDGMLLWAARQWQHNGNQQWPKPMQIRAMIAEKRNQAAKERMQELGQQGCYDCRWTGTRTVVRHLLLARWPQDPADLEVVVNYWVSDDDALHIEAIKHIEQTKNLGWRIQEFVVRCGECQLGASKGNLNPHTEYLDNTPPIREPADEGAKMRAIACRQYVSGTGRRYHPDDTRKPAKGSTTTRYYNVPSPEEKHGPLKGAAIRQSVANGGSRGARSYLGRNLKRSR